MKQNSMYIFIDITIPFSFSPPSRKKSHRTKRERAVMFSIVLFFRLDILLNYVEY